MPIDLGKLSKTSLLDTETNPREIFNLIPDKAEKYKYPRDVQSEVWDRWFTRRMERDLVLKMNTGSGKTVVGLLILKSCLNEKVGPAIYIAPDKYLARQVVREAEDLKVSVVTEPTAGAFLQGKAILVTNIYQLINGKSVFGTADRGIKIPIGSLLVDDAHACLATTETQFTFSIPYDYKLYGELLKLFKDELLEQNDSKFFEIEAGAAEQEMLVPFWAWHHKSSEVAKLVMNHQDHEAVLFNWPLMKNHLELCRCVFSGRRVEISPKCLPIDAIPSFTEAKRRIFMTATLADDSILVSDFGANATLVTNHITPKVANDIGDRIILLPQEIDPDLAEDDLKKFLKKKSKRYNTVVIVPSSYRAEYWKDVANAIVTADNLEAVVAQLKSKLVGLVVLVNKYDGIDLPGDACRILVLDGLPQARRLYDRVETNILAGSAHAIARQMQRIEQGMGRGIRANDDYCVVLLMGASLTRTIFTIGAKQMLSPATQAQLEQSDQIAHQLGAGLDELDQAIELCLGQDKKWKRVAREAVANVAYPAKGEVRAVAIAQREAFDSAAIRSYRDAENGIQKLVTAAVAGKEAESTIGWLRWQVAEYAQFRDPVQAQQILKAALKNNRRLTRPIDGIDYERLDSDKLEQAKNAAWKIRTFSGKANNLLVHVNGILDDLTFAPDNAAEFEAAMQQIAEFLGFRSQRPELEFKSGPDVLWAVGNLRYFVIECKSSATVPMVNKYYTNQLSGSVNWFHARYDQSSSCVPILIHPSNTFEPAATPHPDTRVITAKLLLDFKQGIREFVKAAASNVDSIDVKQAQELLDYHDLSPDRLLQKYSVGPKKK